MKRINNNPITSPNNYKKDKLYKDNQCCARAMGPRYHSIRCNNIAIGNIEYCKKHLYRIEEYGYLAFGRYDEPKPIINEKGNKIPWRNTSAIEDINTIIQYQHMNLKKIIK